jgi:hypothetical protein
MFVIAVAPILQKGETIFLMGLMDRPSRAPILYLITTIKYQDIP